jgi:hypothetical protein
MAAWSEDDLLPAHDGATHVEKSTVAHGALNAVPTSGGSSSGGAQGAAGGFGAAGGDVSSGGLNAQRWRRSKQTARCARCVRATPASTNAKLASNAARMS